MNDSSNSVPPSQNGEHFSTGEPPRRFVLDPKTGGSLSEDDAQRQLAGYLAATLATGLRLSELKELLSSLQSSPDSR